MKIGYLDLLNEKYPMCFSYGAAAELTDEFGSLQGMEEQVFSDDLTISVPATNTMIEVLMKYGRIYAQALGDYVPPPLPCRVVDLIPANDKTAVSAVFAAIAGDAKREVEVQAKNVPATQGGEALRGCITTGPKQG